MIAPCLTYQNRLLIDPQVWHIACNENIPIAIFTLLLIQEKHLSDTEMYTIRKTYPCNEYPPIPHFHTLKLGNAVVYLFFLFLL